MSGNKCRTPIYSHQRPAAIRPPPRGLVCLRLSCPHISRVHCERVNIPLPSVCTGRTQDEARPSPGCFWWGWGHCGRQTPGCLQAGGLLALSGSQTQVMPPPPPLPPLTPRPPGCLCLLLSLLFAFNPRIRPISRERSRREDEAGAVGSAQSQRGSALAV